MRGARNPLGRGNSVMKLLSVAIPSYNSQEYLHHAVESLLGGGNDVEILIVDDGSKDRTGEIADDFERRYPGLVRAVHKENGGHGDAVMCGLKHATGLYFKVVDSDDWVDEGAYPRILDALRAHVHPREQIDLLVSNYIYDKVGASHKHVVRYANALPEGRVLTWDDVGRFHMGQYILMHSAIYRTALLRESGLTLPKHTFYVDNLYVYVPMARVKTLLYLNEDFYHYFIGRDDQSVQANVMMKRIDQQLRVNRLMFEGVDLLSVEPPRKRRYMRNYLEIITSISTIFLIMIGTPESLAQRDALWREMREKHPKIYKNLRHRPLGIALNLPGKPGRALALAGYKVARNIFGFN